MALNDISRSEIWSYLNKDMCLPAFGRIGIHSRLSQLIQSEERKLNKLKVCLGPRQYVINVKCKLLNIGKIYYLYMELFQSI